MIKCLSHTLLDVPWSWAFSGDVVQDYKARKEVADTLRASKAVTYNLTTSMDGLPNMPTKVKEGLPEWAH